MRSPRASLWLSIIGNTFLFLSSLLLLIDIGPRDWMPSYQAKKEAIETLRARMNILGSLPPDVSVKGETSTLKLTSNPGAFVILRDFIQERSPLAGGVHWSAAVGVGFSILSLPVGVLKLDAFHPLYIIEMPEGDNDRFLLRPVGQLSDLESWLSTWRQSALTKTALVLLLLGFLLQLVEAVLKLLGVLH